MHFIKRLSAFFIAVAILVSATLVNASAFCFSFGTERSDIRLNASIISDTHIDYREFIGQGMLAAGLYGLKRADSPVDTVIVSGDLTNYGDNKSIDKFFKIFDKYCPFDKWIIATGNHDVGHVEDMEQEEARQYFINKYNQYSDEKIDSIYYSTLVNGYRFIVLGDEDDDSWDWPLISDEQLAFLDSELQKSASENKPAFVISHWPLDGVNGEKKIWDVGDIHDQNDEVTEIVEKYKNVFFISGHLHAGINGALVKSLFGFSCVETINGVNYVNLPTYALVNRYGIPWGGTGFQMEVYDDEVLFRARNFITSHWYNSYEYSVELV